MAAISRASSEMQSFPLSEDVLQRVCLIDRGEVHKLNDEALKGALASMRYIASICLNPSREGELSLQVQTYLTKLWNKIDSDAKTSAISWVLERTGKDLAPHVLSVHAGNAQERTVSIQMDNSLSGRTAEQNTEEPPVESDSLRDHTSESMSIERAPQSVLLPVRECERDSDSKDVHDGEPCLLAAPVVCAAEGPVSRSFDEFNPATDASFQKHIRWKPRGLSSEASLPKMVKNAQKAVMEHAGTDPAYMGIEGAIPSMESLRERRASPLTFTKYEWQEQGPRDAMEDAHFYRETDGGVLTGVFDGHGGKIVAQRVSDAFVGIFLEHLGEGLSPHAAFEKTIDSLQGDIVRSWTYNRVGSTAVVSYIDKETGLIYTATLGDSEANIYRRQGDSLKSIPLSCVRDWSSKNDAKRAAHVLMRPSIAREWPDSKTPKELRVPSARRGVNVSRAFGDSGWVMRDQIAFFHKPKITVNKLQVGDMLVLACDGLKDYVSETDIVKRLETPMNENPAKDLVIQALNVPAFDNVTVLAVRVGE